MGKSVAPKTCWECRFLEEDMQSDMTPGYNSTIECRKGHFGVIAAVDAYEEDQKVIDEETEAWDKAIARAESCPDFKQRPK